MRAACPVLRPEDRQAVCLKFERSAKQRGLELEARIDRGKRDGNPLLDIVYPQPLECPAGDADVAVRADALALMTLLSRSSCVMS